MSVAVTTERPAARQDACEAANTASMPWPERRHGLDKQYTMTIPVAPYRYAYISLPGALTPKEWKQFLSVIRVARRALTKYGGPRNLHCKRGHLRTSENMSKVGACKVCRADRQRGYRAAASKEKHE